MTAFKIMSDLHLEFQDGQKHEFHVPFDGEDALLLAGDVQCGMVLEEWFCELLKHRPVFYIMGNHEYYHHDLAQLKQGFRDFDCKVNRMAKERGYQHLMLCLQDDAAFFKGTVILGTSLWTNFDENPIAAIQAQRCMNDFALITCDGEEMIPAMIIDEHRKSLAFLEEYINPPNVPKIERKLVVMTHHAPSYQSVAGQYRGDLLNAAYANRLDALVEKVDLWVHGHTHHSFDYRIGEGRVICNPRGYYPRHLNKDFNPHLLVR